jgi:hypothetical protein
MLDRDTFLTALYYFVDELYLRFFAAAKPPASGHPAAVSDSEVLALALLAQWHKRRSERAFLDYAARHLRGYFPRLLSQSAFNKRVRGLTGVLCRLAPALARRLSEWLGRGAAYQLVDGFPVPLLRRCRGEKRRLFSRAEADFGYNPLDKQYDYGVKLFAAIDDRGMVTGFTVGPASTEEHFLAEALLEARALGAGEAPGVEPLAPAVLAATHKPGGRRVGPRGPLWALGAGEYAAAPYLADRGLRGREWRGHWQAAYGAAVLTREAYDALPAAARRAAAAWHSGLRQAVETGFNDLLEELGPRAPRARSFWGLLARLGAKLAALNVLRLVNALCGRPLHALFDPLYA